MAKIQNPTKVITGINTRWSYANVWDAKSRECETFSVNNVLEGLLW